MHWWEGEGGRGFYVDMARSIKIDQRAVSYVDLFLDLSFHDGKWSVLDEDELALALPDDATTARSAQREVERLIAQADPLFDFDHALWAVPSGADRLRPRADLK